MAITTKLELRQSQSLVMTPQLQQAIKLLQLSNMELAAFVETELERNPLLERAEGDEAAAVNGEAGRAPLSSLFKDESQDGEAPRARRRAWMAPQGDGDWLDLQADDKRRRSRRSRHRAAGRLSRCRRLHPRRAEGFRLERPQPEVSGSTAVTRPTSRPMSPRSGR